ncbi:MAG TPA: hypothetical protein VMZ27_04715 [Candidatus Saccharimonadales bacterium]|nr:hypothetical protein [Candidatus Saccharimonadales bacterium]
MGFRLCASSRILKCSISAGAHALLFAGLFFVVGCATSSRRTNGEKPFVFQQDTFSYANELVWIYDFDPITGESTHWRREPPPSYSHHCFVVARSAKQFFQHARFDPSRPKASEPAYRDLVAKVVSTSPSRFLPENERIIIPGYSNLFTFSRDWSQVLQQECGGAWRSYLQRGHWRMIWPFSRREQNKMAAQLLYEIKDNRPPVVHVVRFPQLKINHSVLLFAATEDEKTIRFSTYDPNAPERPTELTYDRASRTFTLPKNEYFEGGRVDVYQIYHRWNY